jgi:hypothetical protein
MSTFPPSSHSRLIISEVRTASNLYKRKYRKRGGNENDMMKEGGKGGKIR